MSSAISTKAADTQVRPYAGTGAKGTPNGAPAAAASGTLLPWQFFVLAALGCATAVNVIVRGQGITTIVLLTLVVFSTALVGIAALRTLNPLVTDEDDRTAIVGGRTRAALEREKMLALRAIKELEFDRAMGKVSESDFDEMGGRLRARAARLIRQLDAGATYRDEIEADLARRLGEDAAHASPSSGGTETPAPTGAPVSARSCACGTPNDADAKFCKACGAKL